MNVYIMASENKRSKQNLRQVGELIMTLKLDGDLERKNIIITQLIYILYKYNYPNYPKTLISLFNGEPSNINEKLVKIK